MNRRRMLALFVPLASTMTVVVMLWVFSSVGAAPPGQGPSPVPQAAILTSFSYQGRLTDPTSGSPVSDGTYSMTFRLYDAPAAVTAFWTWTDQVSVTNGLFNVLLPVNAQDFTGEGRWLGVQVGTDAEMLPRQPLLPVPYALTLLPGGMVSSALPGPLFTFYNTGTGPGMLGRAASANRAGVTGVHEAAGGYGVLGRNDTAGGTGVHGISDWGVGGAFTSSQNIGLFATGGYRAILTEGDVHVDGDLSWYTRTGYVSLAPSAFVPRDESYSYDRGPVGTELEPDTPGTDAYYFASVSLPHGATVTKFTMYYYDNSLEGAITATLRYGNMGATSYTMAQVTSSDVNYGDADDTSIDYATVDNETRAYFVKVLFPTSPYSNNLVFKGIVIEYQYTEPH